MPLEPYDELIHDTPRKMSITRIVSSSIDIRQILSPVWGEYFAGK